MSRRFASLLAAALLALAAPAQAEDYPSRPIRLLISTPAGSLVDTLGRLLGQDLGARLGQSIVADNKPGGTTMIAVNELNRAPPDGYTLLINTSEATMLPFLKRSYHTDPVKDFTPIALVVTSWTVFAVNPNVPAKTLPELVAYSKTHPGGVRYGAGGAGGVLNIAVEELKLKSGGNFVFVPYRGGAQAATDAISGQIEMVSMGLASTRVAEGGKLRILAQTGPRRHPMLPDVPTTAEAGLPDVRTWFGLVGPPGMPKDVVDKLAREVGEVMNNKALQDKFSKLGMAVDYRPGADFVKFMNDDTKKWRELLPAMGIPQVD